MKGNHFCYPTNLLTTNLQHIQQKQQNKQQQPKKDTRTTTKTATRRPQRATEKPDNTTQVHTHQASPEDDEENRTERGLNGL